MATQTRTHISQAEYLALERVAEFPSEYYDGRIFPMYEVLEDGTVAMAGATRNHGVLASNLSRLLGNALEDRPCIVLSEIRVFAPQVGFYTYPDMVVVCDDEQYQENRVRDTLLNPQLIVEVLSPSTEAYDRGQKFAFYQSIDSVQEYALVAQHRTGVDVFRRTEGGAWVYTTHTEGEVELVACVISLDALYRNVRFDSEREDV